MVDVIGSIDSFINCVRQIIAVHRFDSDTKHFFRVPSSVNGSTVEFGSTSQGSNPWGEAICINTFMSFDTIYETLLEKKEKDPEPPGAYAIEITEDESRGELFNQLGKIIKQLAQVRNRL